MTIILPLGTKITYKQPICPCDGGGWTHHTSTIIDFVRDKMTFYRTECGHIVMPEWIEQYV